MKKMSILLGIAILTLTACVAQNKAKQNLPGIDVYGGCTKETIKAFKAVARESEILDIDPSEETAKSTLEKCEKLKTLIGDEECRGINAFTKKPLTVSFSMIQPLCNQANGLMKGFSGSKR